MACLTTPSRLSHLLPPQRPNPFHFSSLDPPRRTTIVAASRRTLPKKQLRYPRRQKLPPDDAGIPRAPLKLEEVIGVEEFASPGGDDGGESDGITDGSDSSVTVDESVWAPDEIEAITSLFERGPPKPKKPRKERPLPIPKPTNNGTPKFPTPKDHIRSSAREALATRLPFSERVYKNPETLAAIAKQIGELPKDVDASEVLDTWSKFLRKGSLSMTIRELGHMGLPDRAMQVLCWAQKNQPVFFPDDRILASAVEVLARNSRLRMEDKMENYLHSASRSVMEAMARGFIRGGNLKRARKILLYAKDHNRKLDASIHAKLILEAGRDPDSCKLVEVLLEELGQRKDLDLRPQDCTAVMKVCIRYRKFEAVESLFNWYKASSRKPTVVMYTTVMYSRYCSGEYREGLVVIWEMEESNILLDLPAYRVVIKLLVALEDLDRAARYFSRLKEAGFVPTYDIYRDMIKAYATSGRLAKCRKICKDVEAAGFQLDSGILSFLSMVEQGESVT